MLLEVEWGRVRGCEQAGKVAQEIKEEEDLPQGVGDPCQGGLQQDEDLFLVKLLRSGHLGKIG